MSDKLKFPVKVKKESGKKRERAKKRAERLLWKLENGYSVRLYDFTPWFASSVLLAYAGIFAIDVYFIVAVEKSRIAAIVVGAVFLASLLAVIPLTILTRVFAILQKTPVTVFLLSGIFPLVPGAGIYYTAYYFIQGDNALALSNGVSTFKVAVALAVGISLVLSIPLPPRHRSG